MKSTFEFVRNGQSQTGRYCRAHMEYIDGEWKGGTLAFSLGGKGANIYGGMFYYELPNNIYDNMHTQLFASQWQGV